MGIFSDKPPVTHDTPAPGGVQDRTQPALYTAVKGLLDLKDTLHKAADSTKGK